MNSTIVLEDGKSIKITKKVIDSKQIGSVVIVLTDSGVERQFNNENVYGYDLNGKELWQIKDLNLFHELHDYTGMYIIDSWNKFKSFICHNSFPFKRSEEHTSELQSR